MDVIIKEAKYTKGLFQIEYWDCDLGMHMVAKDKFFETEEFAERYGRETFSYEQTGNTEFRRVIMHGGKEAPENTVLYGDANHPGDVYVCPEGLEAFLLQFMDEEGLCPYKLKGRWYPADSCVCFVAAAPEAEDGCLPINFDWHDESPCAEEEARLNWDEEEEEEEFDYWEEINAQQELEDESEEDKEFYRLEQKLLGHRVRE